MFAASVQLPQLACSLSCDEPGGRQLLDALLSGLVAARAPPALRFDFRAQAIEAAQTPEAVLFFRRLVDGSVGDVDAAGDEDRDESLVWQEDLALADEVAAEDEEGRMCFAGERGAR